MNDGYEVPIFNARRKEFARDERLDEYWSRCGQSTSRPNAASPWYGLFFRFDESATYCSHHYGICTRREFLREILYKNIAIIGIQHGKFILLTPLAIFPILLGEIHSSPSGKFPYTQEENFMAIFTTLSMVIWFSTDTRGIFATLVYVFTMHVVIYDILSKAIIPTLSTSILFCNLCYILL